MEKDKDLGIFQHVLRTDISEVRLSAVDSTDNYFITGDEKGNICSYELSTQNNNMTLDHQQFVLKGKIEQIKCLPHLNMAFVLVNGNLFGYSIPRLDQKFRFDKETNIHKIAVNEFPGLQNQLMVMTKKRKVKCYEYNAEISKLIEMKIDELSVYEISDVLEWYGEWFCCANKKKFFLTKITDGLTLQQDIEGVTNSKNVNGSWLIYVNPLGIFIEQNNTPKQQNVIAFSTKQLVNIGIYKNYVISLHENVIGVFDANDSSQIQEIQLEHGSVGKFLTVGPKKVFYVISNSFSDKKEVNYSYQVYELKELAFEKQIFKLLNDNKIEEALNILNNNISSSSDEKTKKIEQFFIDCSWACLKKCDFEKAYHYAKLTNFNPFEFIYLFKNILSLKILHEDLKKINFPTIESITQSKDEYISDALNMLILLLQDKRNLILSTYDIPKDFFKKTYYIGSENSLINLFNKDNKNDFTLNAVFETINTVLVKLYVKKKENVKKIFEIVDYEFFQCDWDDLENFLYMEKTDESKIAMAYLYEKRNRYEQALKIWQDYGNVEANPVLCREAQERTKIILKKSQDKKLFHDYIQWILVKNCTNAFELFLYTEIVPVEYFFSTIIGTVEKNFPNINLKEKFLEFYIANNCVNERYHTILAEIYIERLFKMRKNDSSFESSLVEGNLKTYLEKFDKLLKTSTFYNKTHILEKIKDSWLIDQEIFLYSKLNLHNEAISKLVLMGVSNNDFEKVEKYCTEMLSEKSDLFAELFKILSENYQNNINGVKTAKNEKDKKMFESSSQIFQKEMLTILKKYGDANTLDPFIVLNQLPIEWTLSDQSLYEYLTKIMKNYTHMSNKYKIAKNLSEMAVLYKEKELIESKNKSLTIGNETQCELCKKKIGNTIFCVYPNMKIYHNKCAPNPNVCPVTRTDFTKKQLF